MMSHTRPLRISFLIAGFGQGGAQRQCAMLLNELAMSDELEITLIYFYEGEHFHILDTSRLNLVKLNTTSFYNPKNILKIRKATKEAKADILFSWLQASDVYAYFVSKATPKLKWIIAERDSNYPNTFKFKLRKILGRGADMVICNSTKGKRYWSNDTDTNEQIHVIPNISPASRERSKPAFSGIGRKILYAGRLEDQKNIINIASAFSIATNRLTTSDFHIIGNGSREADIREIIKKSAAPDRFRLMPHQTDIFAFYEKSDIFVNASNHEGMPNTVIESILSGCLVVASPIPEHIAILGEDYPFYIEDIASPQSIAEAICKAADNNTTPKIIFDIAAKLSQNTPREISKQYEECFKRLVITSHR